MSATGLDEDAYVMLVASGDMAVVRFEAPEIETVRGSSERLKMTVMLESQGGGLRQQLVLQLGRIAAGAARQQWWVISSEPVHTEESPPASGEAVQGPSASRADARAWN